MDKNDTAFLTIGEVAELLDLPHHVLRYWESRFSQIKPIKKGRGRRYYRPEDVDLLRGIRYLLYSERFTIRGVQRVFSERGKRFVALCWQRADQSGSPYWDQPEREDRSYEGQGNAGAARAHPSDREESYFRLGNLKDQLPDHAPTLRPGKNVRAERPASPVIGSFGGHSYNPQGQVEPQFQPQQPSERETPHLSVPLEPSFEKLESVIVSQTPVAPDQREGVAENSVSQETAFSEEHEPIAEVSDSPSAVSDEERQLSESSERLQGEADKLRNLLGDLRSLRDTYRSMEKRKAN